MYMRFIRPDIFVKEKKGFYFSKPKVFWSFMIGYFILLVLLSIFFDLKTFGLLGTFFLLLGKLQKTGENMFNRVQMVVPKTYTEYYFFIFLIYFLFVSLLK